MPSTLSEPLPGTMRAVVCHGPQDYRLEEVPTPAPEPGEVVIRIEAAGVCASDVKCWAGAKMFWGDGATPGYCQAPIIAGHEFIGIVVALGNGASEKYGLAIGDRAISEQIVPCWNCRYCVRGQYHLCAVHDIYGFRSRVPGGWADYMKFPAGALNHKVPHTIRAEHAALIEPLACSLHAVNRAGIQIGDVAVIAGCGTLGLGMVAFAAQRGAGALVAIDLADDRLERAKRLGATHTVNPTRDDVPAMLRALTDGYGCDVYIEATGHPAAVEQGLKCIRKAGTFVEFSVFKEPVTTDWTVIGDGKELNLLGAHLGPFCYPPVIRALETGTVDAEVFLSHRLPLERFTEGLETVYRGRDSLKVLLMP